MQGAFRRANHAELRCAATGFVGRALRSGFRSAVLQEDSQAGCRPSCAHAVRWPRFVGQPGGGAVGRDPMMVSQRHHLFPGPPIAVAGNQPVAVQQPRDQIVAGDADQQSDGIDDVGCGAVALAAAPLRQAPFSMDAARRMNGQHDLAGVLIDIGDHLADHGSNDAFLEP